MNSWRDWIYIIIWVIFALGVTLLVGFEVCSHLHVTDVGSDADWFSAIGTIATLAGAAVAVYFAHRANKIAHDSTMRQTIHAAIVNLTAKANESMSDFMERDGISNRSYQDFCFNLSALRSLIRDYGDAYSKEYSDFAKFNLSNYSLTELRRFGRLSRKITKATEADGGFSLSNPIVWGRRVLVVRSAAKVILRNESIDKPPVEIRELIKAYTADKASAKTVASRQKK